MDPDIKDKILSRRRADEIGKRAVPQMSLQEFRRKFGGAGVSDEEILLRFFTSKEDVDTIFGYPGGSNLPMYDTLHQKTLHDDLCA